MATDESLGLRVIPAVRGVPSILAPVQRRLFKGPRLGTPSRKKASSIDRGAFIYTACNPGGPDANKSRSAPRGVVSCWCNVLFLFPSVIYLDNVNPSVFLCFPMASINGINHSSARLLRDRGYKDYDSSERFPVLLHLGIMSYNFHVPGTLTLSRITRL